MGSATILRQEGNKESELRNGIGVQDSNQSQSCTPRATDPLKYFETVEEWARLHSSDFSRERAAADPRNSSAISRVEKAHVAEKAPKGGEAMP